MLETWYSGLSESGKLEVMLKIGELQRMVPEDKASWIIIC